MSDRLARILIVDDAEDNRLVVHDWLQGDYDVIDAENGRKAMELLDYYKNSISLVLLDISLPEISGYDVLIYLKGQTSLKDIPVIAVTAHARDQDREKALSNGFDDFLSKPFRLADLSEKIEKNLKQKA
jgi:CheY-like chemotaxis protein